MAASPPPPIPTAEEIRAIRAVKSEELGWLPPDPTQRKNVYFEKMKENPLVPIGAAATVGALMFGLLNFKRGNMAKSQLAMRLRVLAQTGTVVALAGGVLWKNAQDAKATATENKNSKPVQSKNIKSTIQSKDSKPTNTKDSKTNITSKT